MRVRFQADADFNHIILKAALRREPGIDFNTPGAAANLVGLSDDEVMAIAAQAGRVLLTHDRRTMPKHFGEFIVTGTSAGVIVVPQRAGLRARVVEDLILIWAASDSSEWVNRLQSLPF
jgi:hypothetical protein